MGYMGFRRVLLVRMKAEGCRRFAVAKRMKGLREAKGA